jgi:DNA-directed RNA polymerase specialized sigma24 family protein
LHYKNDLMLRCEIDKLVTCERFNSYCKNLTKGNLIYEDLKSQVILTLCEMNNEALATIENATAYANQIAFKEWINKYSDFNKLIEKKINEFSVELSNQIEDTETNIDKDYCITVKVIESELLNDIKKNKFPVEHYFFKAYLQHKTIRATAKHLNIPRSTVHRIIQSYRQRIKDKTE